tara:strand:+ start:325 stop:603 length:279 start_codon:yes stop_codon:yes gene_type:complete
MKCSTQKFKKKDHNTGYDGSKVWQKLHNACNDIGCDHCKNECKLYLEGVHDIVNAKLEKPIKHPKSLEHLTKDAITASHSTSTKLECKTCQG